MNHSLSLMRILLIALIIGCFANSTAGAEPKFTPEQLRFYEKDVQPILKEHCWKCHGAEEKVKGEPAPHQPHGILLKGGDLGPAVNERKWEDSSCCRRSTRRTTWRCRPRASCREKDIDTLTHWVKDGLPDARHDGRRQEGACQAGRRGHRRGEEVLGLSADEAAAGSDGEEQGLGEEPDRRLHPGEARSEGTDAREAGRSRCA